MRVTYYNTINEQSINESKVFIKLSNSRLRLLVVLLSIFLDHKRHIFIISGSSKVEKRINAVSKWLGVSFVKDNTEQYYDSLATSKYIYTDQNIDPYFINRKQQFVYVYQSGKNDQNSDYLFDLMQIKSSFVEKQLKKDTRAFFNAIKTGNYTEKNNSIVIMVSKAYSYLLESFIPNYVDSIIDEYDKVVLFIDSDIPELDRNMTAYDNDRIIVTYKRDKMILDQFRRDHLDDHVEAVKQKRATEVDPTVSRIYREEAFRMLGRNPYEVVINFGFTSIYWLSIIYALNTDSIFHLYSSDAVTELREYLASVYGVNKPGICIEEFFSNREFDQYCSDRFLAYIPKLNNDHIDPVKQGVCNNETILISNVLESGFNGTKILDLLPFFDIEDRVGYIIVDNSLKRRQWIQLINNLNIKDLHIYDFFGIIRDYDIPDKKIIREHSVLYSLINRYSECIVYEGSGIGIHQEADFFNKNIMITDINGDIIQNDKDRSKAFLTNNRFSLFLDMDQSNNLS